MNENECLNTQFELLKGLFFDDRFETDEYILCTSKTIDDHFWNLAFIKNRVNDEVLSEIENKLHSINRGSCIYIGTSNDNYEYNKNYLLEKGYEVCDSDTYMVLDSKKDIDINIDIKDVETIDEYNDFMDTLSSAYNDSEENPDENVYAGSITKCYYDAVKNTIGSKEHVHVIAYDNGTPVSVATLSFANGICGVNSVGTRQGYWNKGYGKQLIAYIIKKCEEMGIKTLLLSTEYHSKNQQFYEKLGFKVIYVMEQFTK